MNELVLATRNPGKVEEIRELLADLPITLYTLEAFPEVPEVEEDADTLEGNALKKARTVHAVTGLPALADDTGLEVEALGGAPGVHSARYAGPEGDSARNRARLLRELEGVSHRKARFRTVVALVDATGEWLFEGVCEGTITEEERGDKGFGYDPLFVPAGDTRTFAELSLEEKNRISHRGRALRALRDFLETRLRP